MGIREGVELGLWPSAKSSMQQGGPQAPQELTGCLHTGSGTGGQVLAPHPLTQSLGP